uniref:Transmembrane serine protease 5 n=1 Tax=Myotis myotis TaxID=51298 RepID=A0A7J7VLQ1_MYOMY|nr:transmembrane serine protease 5 [Myotis myotis]
MQDVAPECSFRLARLSSWRVHAGLVSHSVVRPHEDLWWRGSSPTLYSAQNYNYDVALLRLSFSAHGWETLKDTVVLLLSTQLCNSSCVYNGGAPPPMLCVSYLDRRADACQVGGGESSASLEEPLALEAPGKMGSRLDSPD